MEALSRADDEPVGDDPRPIDRVERGAADQVEGMVKCAGRLGSGHRLDTRRQEAETVAGGGPRHPVDRDRDTARFEATGRRGVVRHRYHRGDDLL